jgi:DNA modification methylase
MGGLVTNNYEYRNKRDVWMVNPSHFKEAHFATFPEELVRPMVLAGCPKDGVVLDPFMGSGTTGVVAKNNCRNYVGCELNPEYIKIAEERLNNTIKRLF